MSLLRIFICVWLVLAFLVLVHSSAYTQGSQAPDGVKQRQVERAPGHTEADKEMLGESIRKVFIEASKQPVPPVSIDAFPDGLKRKDESKEKQGGIVMPQSSVTMQQGNVPSPPAVRGHEWTDVEIWLSCAVLVFGVIAMLIALVVVIRTYQQWKPRDVTNLFGLVLIVTGALVLVTAGYSSQQITGVIGLLGSLGGYLLGSRNKE